MKSVYNLGQTTKQDSAKFWVGDTEIKEGYPLSPHVEQKMERKKFQRTRSLPKNARFPTSNKDIHNRLVLRGLFLRKERRNPSQISTFVTNAFEKNSLKKIIYSESFILL